MFSTEGFTFSNIMAGIIFSGVGLVVFVYGKKMGRLKPLLVGIALMAYPYFFSGTLTTYLIGIALTAALYFWRE